SCLPAPRPCSGADGSRSADPAGPPSEGGARRASGGTPGHLRGGVYTWKVRTMTASTTALKPVAEQVVLDRRYLPAHPELAFEEHDTARFIAERLRSHGLEVRSGVARTGVVGLLRGGRPGRTVLLRADIDALAT